MSKYKINRDECIGCGLCNNLYPEKFIINEEGIAEVKEDDIKDDERAEEVLSSCPTSAIYKEDK